MCAAVIQTLFTKLTINPCIKNLPEQCLAIMYAQKIKMISQKKGSIFCGIRDIVANPIAKPKSDS